MAAPAPASPAARGRLQPPPGLLRPGAGPLPPVLAEALLELAERLRRLSPDRRDPERFHMDKSELVADLRKFANSPLILPPPRRVLIPVPGPARAVERLVYVPLASRRRARRTADERQGVFPF